MQYAVAIYSLKTIKVCFSVTSDHPVVIVYFKTLG